MRRGWIALAVGAALVLGAAPSDAGPLAGGELKIRLGFYPRLPRLVTQANPGGATFDGTAIAELTSPRPFGPVSLDLPDTLFTGVPTISDLRAAGLAKPATPATLSPGGGSAYTGNVSAAGGGFGGIAPLSGSVTLCANACALLAVKIPLAIVGAGGVSTFTALGQPGTVTAGAGWTTGAAVIRNINTEVLSYAGHTCARVTCGDTTAALGTGIGVYRTAVTLSGTNALTAGGGGQVTLVTPVRTNSLAGQLPLFASETLVFQAPEPGSLLLLGGAVAGLVAAGRRRLRR